MQINRAVMMVALLLATSCATTPPAPQQPVQLRDLPIGNTEVDLLADLIRREDSRQYDSAAFHGFVTAQSPVVRRFAVRALGRIGKAAASGLLLRALSDSNRQVVAEAAFALGELGDSAPHIITALGTLSAGDAVDAAEAVAALGKLRTPAARTYVERVLSGTPSAPVLQEALLAIWRFPRNPATTPLIVQHTRNPDESVRWRATYALTRGFADPAAVPVLIDLLRGQGSGWTQSFAARGLRAASADSAGRRADAFAALFRRSASTRSSHWAGIVIRLPRRELPNCSVITIRIHAWLLRRHWAPAGAQPQYHLFLQKRRTWRNVRLCAVPLSRL